MNLAESYYPPGESTLGWRTLKDDEDVRKTAGLDPRRLEVVKLSQLTFHQGPWSIVIVRRGYLVREWYALPSMPATTYDLWSSTKSVTGIAFGMLIEDSRQGTLPDHREIDLDSPAYDFIPEGHPLSDHRKKQIKMRHLLTMTSGIPGERRNLEHSCRVWGSRVRVCTGKGAKPLRHICCQTHGRTWSILELL